MPLIVVEASNVLLPRVGSIQFVLDYLQSKTWELEAMFHSLKWHTFLIIFMTSTEKSFGAFEGQQKEVHIPENSSRYILSLI